ncbi:MAG: PD40 domain-containing protein [Bdellovibrionales bacterium]|nr:PD40 domain-containing protein [Bdellovibrionales bacterium]
MMVLLVPKSLRFQILIASVISVCGLFLLGAPVFAQTKLNIRGAGRLYPIALPRLCMEDGTAIDKNASVAQEIPSVMTRDLMLSGYFDVLNPNSYIETAGKCTTPDEFAYSDWTVLGAEGLVRGLITRSGSKDLQVQMYLYDVQRRMVVLGKQYEGRTDQLREIAHRFSNEVMKFFTGEDGVFGTQIAYSAKVGRFKELYIVDMDGSNPRQLTNDRGLAVSVAWHPSGGRLVYTTYRNRVPNIFSMDLGNRGEKQLTDTSFLEVGPTFLPGGGALFFSQTRGRESHIVRANEDGSNMKDLTPANGAIDVSPSLAPDGRQMAFVSNRSGGPQIFVMDIASGATKRVSFVNSSYCTSPAWSPMNDKLAYVCRADRGFQIFVSGIDGSSPFQLTSSGDNEDPSWSPDGRMLVFATTFGRGPRYNLAIMGADGSNAQQITFGRFGDTDPAWGPRLS